MIKRLQTSFNRVFQANIRQFILDPAGWFLSIRELRSLLVHKDAEAVVDAAFRYIGFGYYYLIHPGQIRSEFLQHEHYFITRSFVR